MDSRSFRRRPKGMSSSIWKGIRSTKAGSNTLPRHLSREREPDVQVLLGTRSRRGEGRLRGIHRLIPERREHFPHLHVYHHSHYEPTALKRLMGLHGTREEEVDNLLRQGALVDLYKVVRQGVRISQPGYGIKKVEVVCMGPRDTSVTEGGQSVLAYEHWIETQDARLLDAIADWEVVSRFPRCRDRSN